MLMDATQKYGYVLIWKNLKLTIHWPGIIKPEMFDYPLIVGNAERAWPLGKQILTGSI